MSSRPPLPLLIVVGAFLAGVWVITAFGVAPLVDEWVYIDAAKTFARESTIHVAPLSFAPAVFEAVYGGLAMKLFGESLTNLVLATAALSLAAGIAFWDLLTRSGLRHLVAALATSTMLFSALFFGLSLTYMTDAHAVSLAIISAALLSRAVDDSHVRPGWLLAGAIAASAGYFSRPGVPFVMTGALIVLIRGGRFAAALGAAIVPTAAITSHFLWSRTGVLMEEGPDALSRIDLPSLESFGGVLVTAAITIGVFLIPLAPAIIREIMKSPRRTMAWAFGGIVGILLIVIITRTQPTLGNWLNDTGIFPIDESTIGSRRPLVSEPTYWAIVFLALLVAMSGVALIARPRSPTRLGSAGIGLWSFAGVSLVLVMVTSVATLGRMLDRYLLVVLPALLFNLVATDSLRSLNSKGLVRQLSVGLTILIAGLTFVLGFDGMRLQSSIHELADSGVSQGISPKDIDAGAAWVGFQYGLTMEPGLGPSNREDWWRVVFAPDINPKYFVSLNTGKSDCQIDSREVDALFGRPNSIALVDSDCLPP